MKTYKEFETVYIGGSDGAALILASYEKLEYLYFGEDGNYRAYFVNEEIELPAHYKKEAEADRWLRIYDDDEKVVEIEADHIEIYRAGEMGCLIYAPNGTYRR
jgi:hypothetical protein F3_01816